MPLALALLVLAPRSTEIIFVRHGETVANATGHYNNRTINAFSERGKKQVEALTVKLRGMKFDTIVVSPSERALRSIAPYLRATHRTATIWPELLECCSQPPSARSKPASPKVRYGSKITVPKDLVGLFTLRPGGERYIDAPTFNDGLRQIKMGWQLIVHDFGNSGKTVLVVGHSIEGGRMMEMLQGKQPLGKLRPGNTEIMHFHQTPDGKFVRG